MSTTRNPASDAAPAMDARLQSIVSGALFDLMGLLTTRDQRITLSGSDDAGCAVEALQAFAKLRNFSLDEADVAGWRAALSAVSTLVAAEPSAKFEDPRVQVAYDLLCSYEAAPLAQHWEGWVARRIVDALDVAPPVPPAEASERVPGWSFAGWFINDAAEGAPPHWAQVASEHANDPDVQALSFECPDFTLPAPVPSEHVAVVAGTSMQRRLQWVNAVAAFDLPIGTKLYAASVVAKPSKPWASQTDDTAGVCNCGQYPHAMECGMPSLYEFTGDIKHYNTLLIPANRIRNSSDAVRSALAELVECKDLKNRAEALHFAGLVSDLEADYKKLRAERKKLQADYIQRQPKAWDAARAALQERQQ